MLSVKTGKIPFSKPRGLLGSSRADIHMSCNNGQVLCTFLMPACAKEKSALTFPADPAFLGSRGHPAGTHSFTWLQKGPASKEGELKWGGLKLYLEKFQFLQSEYNAE